MHPYVKGYENRLDKFDIKFISRNIFLAGLLKLYFRYEVFGFENIPQKGAGIIVMNHGILPLDGFLLGMEILIRLARLPRGLTDHIIFNVPFLRELFLSVGIVDGNRDNALKVLRKGGLLMVMPGGAREGIKMPEDKYKLNWEGRTGFIKIAQMSGAPIVLSFCYGIDDIYEWILHKTGRKTEDIGVPVLMGLGILPLPVKLTQVISKPIFISPKKDPEEVKKSLMREMRRLYKKAKLLSIQRRC
ncbi:MAG: acyltransferase family protein [Deltaproteobacteria bacterium]|nr:acyltransferase family protein [Deltaproteobacteria bacterium]